MLQGLAMLSTVSRSDMDDTYLIRSCLCMLQGLAMLATVMCFDWDQEAKAAAVLMNTQHDALGPESEALLHPASEAGSIDGGER